jgi:REG-2-like HAD superfamily hydrolase
MSSAWDEPLVAAGDATVNAALVRAVTWDAVGTLFVPSPSVGAIYAEIARGHGIDADAERLQAAFPGAFSAVRARWKVPYGSDEEDALRFWSEVIIGTFQDPLPFEMICDLYDAFARAARWRVLPGVREALAWVSQQHIPQAVISNYDARLLPLITELELGPFVAVIPSSTVGRAKPDPAVLMEACRRLGVKAQEVVHIGDHPREDGEMCARSGARFLSMHADGVPLAALREALAA